MLVPKKEPAHPRSINPQETVAKRGYLSNQGQDFPPSRLNHISTFFKAVAQDCPCERCCGLRDTADMLDNPGQEY